MMGVRPLTDEERNTYAKFLSEWSDKRNQRIVDELTATIAKLKAALKDEQLERNRLASLLARTP